jgi:adenylosuccinate synthase
MRCGDLTLADMPSDITRLSQCEPVYESMPGWSEPTKGARQLVDLPTRRADTWRD